MKAGYSKILILVLALAIVPGAVELLENAMHWVTEGHLAHADADDDADGDRHDPPGPEHGCTPIFHFCGCHASLAFLGASPPPAIHLRAAGVPSRQDPDSRLTGFRLSIDRPPQA